MKSPWIVPVLTAALLGAGGCTNPDPHLGYTLASQYRPGIHTVAVPVWNVGPDEYRRELEFRITEALVKHIESSTPYKVTDAARAETLLTGTLQRVRQRVLSFDPRDGRAREIQVRFHVDFTWKDQRTGQILVERKDFRVASTYIPPCPMSETFFHGSEDAVNILARRIVEEFAQPW